MPYSYEIDTARRLVITTVWGELTLADIKAHQAALSGNPAFAPTFYQLIDMTKVTKVALDSEAIRQIAGRKLFARGSRRALVAPTAELFGMSRMFEAYRELEGGQETLQVFRDRDEAMRWLFEGTEPGR